MYRNKMQATNIYKQIQTTAGTIQISSASKQQETLQLQDLHNKKHHELQH